MTLPSNFVGTVRRRPRPVTPEVNAYLQALPDNRRARITGLIDMIAALYPDALLDLKYRMPAFSQGDGWVSVGSQKHYVSLYACSAEHLAAFRELHPGVKGGKGRLNFRDRDDIALDDLKQVVRSAMEQ
ncbi:hypothetical protein BST95_06070 [Halioglobus japonicus]|uniref:DUF1801 domain-containing protein n=1 Tax=Halioglobus japonicus TaxID=930805 RepID=A0AAP8MDJ8_9GAMM|nr:hypothetical protein BST95_06070 [Halioglobus japonicus]PLW85828.1 DUF1801 domain-containing protein [Halioglobus japonicus]